MKIDNISHLYPSTTVNQGKAGERVGSDGQRPDATEAGEVAHLRAPAGDGQDIDRARVEEVRQAIAEGRLEIRADRIADGLIQSVRDLLGEDH
ncbi:flagellar biosynthesis anti-sigma factor FlgM [Alloalcanivorax marinus]|uniref:flagellar biosynthesis anti-sigma factor FlgM n=1 Tax=Alloalcanivorax marinus TaxID=1177169 RepID=UPI001933448F|nr:flagellar biosynthesis anti-sigma factor FlgM [Alloalcanivorax marinus]MBL7251731.1 flagellar biosynthesis anti-sigma factor FlgM [Alloalcanivorax marinus]